MINLNSSIYRLRLDLHEATAQDCVTLNKGETNRRIEIELYENNAPWEFTGNVTAAICISGEEDIFPVDIEGNKVVYEPLGELTGTVGIREVQVRIMESGNTSVDPDEPNTDKLLYAPKFTAIINDVVNDGTATEEQARQGDLIVRLEGVLQKANEGEFDGEDGVSPAVSITEITGGHTITITDADGSHTFDVMDGVKGEQGEQGEPGADGQDGEPGTDGYSPEVTVTPAYNPPGHYVKITSKDYPEGQTFFVADGQGGGGADVPFVEFYGYTELSPEDIAANIAAIDALADFARDKKAFTAVLYTDENDLSFAGFIGVYPTFAYFDTTTRTHYAYVVYGNGTVHVVSVATVDPTAKTLGDSPTQNTAGAFIGQAAIVDSEREIWIYCRAPSEAVPQHFWKRIALFADIPTVPTNVSAFTNDAGYLTEHQSLAEYAKKTELPTATSDLTNDSGFITSSALSGYATETYVGTAIANKADKSSIVTSGATFTAVDNTEYRFGEVASLTMTFPETIDRFDIFVAFTSGTTATAFTFPTGIKWTGDDITDGEFVPAASKRYSIALWYDGSAVNGIVRGVV